MKRGTKFTVSDDLVVTPKKTTSTFCLLKKLQTHTDDLEVQEISIRKAEVCMFGCMLFLFSVLG